AHRRRRSSLSARPIPPSARSVPLPKETIYASGALWKYAQLVGETYKGAVTHPGGGAERHQYGEL
ncbi:MAG: hypothetical protein AAFY59_12305, partial [Pseudomonadota bacterium]